MTETTLIDPNRRGMFRAVLAVLAASQASLAAMALLAPTYFYEEFPFGRGWVEALPAYNEHLIRDVGGLFLATAIVLGAAALWPQRRLVAVALVSFLAFSVPHTTYHLFNLEPYSTGDAIANVLALAGTVLAPLALLLIMRRDDRSGGGSGRPAGLSGRNPASGKPSGGGGVRVAAGGPPGADAPNARIEGVPDSVRNPVVRYAFRESRKHGAGEVMDPIRIYAHHPTIMAGYGMAEMATEKASKVPERIKHLALMRAASMAGCEWCLDFGSSISAAAEVPDEDLRDLPRYGESDRFSDVEKLVLDYATGMSRTPVDVSDELFASLAEHFDEAQLVELTHGIAIENYRARFNWAFGIGNQGFTDGYCAIPTPPEQAAAA